MEQELTMKNDSECGFGYCAGDPACRDKQCPGHPCQQGFPPIDHKYIDAQLNGDAGDTIRSIEADVRLFKTAAFAVALALAMVGTLWVLAS